MISITQTTDNENAPITYTKITSSKSRLSKSFSLDAEGHLHKEGGGQLWEGKVEVCQVESLPKYIESIMAADGSSPWVATYGVPTKDGDTFELVTVDQAAGDLGRRQITRTRDCFAFAKGDRGFLALDYDPSKFLPDPRDDHILSKEELLDILHKVMPEWKVVQLGIVDSTSSYIYKPDGTLLKGKGGKRVLVPIDDASMIPAISEELEKRLWLTGYGRHKITKAGTLIKTTILDLCYGNQPERIDFTPAGAICRDGGCQKRPAPLMVGEKIMASEDIPLTSVRKNSKIKELVAEDRKRREPDAAPVRKAYTEKQVRAMISLDPSISEESARDQVEALCSKQELGMECLVRVEGIEMPVAVSEILSDPVGYHGKKCFPPLDEEDEDYQRYCAKIYSNQSEPTIHSFAHGRTIYKLPRVGDPNDARKEWVFPFSSENDEGAKALLAELTKAQAYFSKTGEKAVFVVGEKGLVGVDETQLESAITDRYRLVEKPRGQAKELRPRDLKRLWSNGQVKFPKCLGVCHIPILHADGSWKTERGYDPESEYYLKGSWEINQSPTRVETQNALDYILHRTWGEYSFQHPEDSRGVLLSLILSGFAIPITEIRPGYIISAPRKDCGKTKLASTINALIDGQVSVKDLQRDTNDLERTLEGDRRLGMRVHIFDNLGAGRQLYESKISMLMTASNFTHKKLHSNDSLQTKNDLLWLFTGNNITTDADNTRRYFCLYIEREASKTFRHEPITFVTNHRDEIIQACVTLINAYREAGTPLISTNTISSFERWDRVVRQCVLWLSREFPEFGIGDPRDNLMRQEEDNAYDRNIRYLFEMIRGEFQDREFSAGDHITEMPQNQDLRLAWSVFYADTKSFLENPVKIGKKLQAFANREEQVSPGVFLTLRRTGTKGNKAHYIMEKRVCQVSLTECEATDDAYLLRRFEEREYA